MVAAGHMCCLGGIGVSVRLIFKSSTGGLAPAGYPASNGQALTCQQRFLQPLQPLRQQLPRLGQLQSRQFLLLS